MKYPRTNGVIIPVTDEVIVDNQKKMDDLLKKLQSMRKGFRVGESYR
jgi:hypothetical protein